MCKTIYSVAMICRGWTKKKFPDVFKSGGNILGLSTSRHLDKFVIIKFSLKWHIVGFCRSSGYWDIDQNPFSVNSLFSQNCEFFLQKWLKRSKMPNMAITTGKMGLYGKNN